MKHTWWKHAVIYHIYIRSFFDSNGDGIGDLNGITQKLQYIKQLGAGAIWLSPFYPSPDADFGYDVADYVSVAPQYGTMKDFENLLAQAHSMGIKVIIDMILNHTSNKHKWFIESSSSLTNPKRDWYIWQKTENKKPPNNWKSSFGKSAWEYSPETGSFYYHSFLKEQPDLNWRNAEVKQQMFGQIGFWLDKGVDGIRLDVINYIVKDKKLRNNPGIINRFFFSKKVFTRNRNKSVKIIKELRSLLDEYPDRMSVGEIFTLPPGNPALVAKYIANGKNGLHLAFDFSLIFCKWNARSVAKSIQKSYNELPPKGWPTIVLSNHDLNRSYSRPLLKKSRLRKARLKALLVLTLKGTPFIYYGEEIGMEDCRIPYERLADPLGKQYWPFYSGRDKSRTPMQWDKAAYSGFSVNEPWLPVNRNYANTNAEEQSNNPESMLNLFRTLIKLRQNSPALMKGKWALYDTGNAKVLGYIRNWKGDMLLILLNFSNKIQAYHATTKHKEIFSTDQFIPHYQKGKNMAPFEGKIFEIEISNQTQQ